VLSANATLKPSPTTTEVIEEQQAFYPTRRWNGPQLACQDIIGLGNSFFNFLENSTYHAYFNMDLRRSPHKPVPKTIYEAKGASPAANNPKITRKTARTAKETALKSITTGPLLEAVGLDKKSLSKLSIYRPLLELEFTLLELLVIGLL
jgi:hypothetical protein